MISFDKNSQQSKIDFLIDNISKAKDMSIATIDSLGNPRTVCVNFDIDTKFNLFWKSEKKSLHSQNLEKNSSASILIYEVYEHYDFAIYTTGTVREVEDFDEIEKLIKIKYTNKGKESKTVEQFLGPSKNRLYIYQISRVYVADKAHKKSEIDLQLLQKFWIQKE